MKHEKAVTHLLIIIFILSQLLGLFLLAVNADVSFSEKGLTVDYGDTAIGQRPDFQGFGSLIYLSVGVAMGTIILLFLIKLKMGQKIWKVWYSLAVVVSITLSLGVLLSKNFAFLLAIIFTYMKLKKPNLITHNVTELLMYAGLAILLVPLFDVFWSSMMLIIISLYDVIAVWKSKHMVDLANFTTQSNLFAGLMVNYKTTKGKTTILLKNKKTTLSSTKKSSAKKVSSSKKSSVVRNAILGGGDIVFPLLFSGSVLTALLGFGFTKTVAFLYSLIIVLGSTTALYFLFVKAKKDKFYPAMPFISAGCFVGLIILTTLLLVV